MNTLLIDTNIYSYAMKGDPGVISILQRASEIGICAISIGELLSGFKAGDRENENQLELMEFLDASRVNLYGIDEETTGFYAEILNQLRKVGTPIPTNDIWIGAVAQQHGLRMFSKDRHFKLIAGLICIPE